AYTTMPMTSHPTSTVVLNVDPTPIGIPAPCDPNYSAPHLRVTATELPNDGTALLPDGVTAMSAGEALSVARLTGLMLKPTAGLLGQRSSFTYRVTDPAGLRATALKMLRISAPTTIGK